MISTRSFIRQASAMASKLLKSDPRLIYDFVPATAKDLGVMVDLCCSDFTRIEPHGRALGLTGAEAKHLFEYIVGTALHYSYSLKVIEKSSGKLIGIRTLSIGQRDNSLDFEPFKFEDIVLSENIIKLVNVLTEAKRNFWATVDPSVSKVIRREISFVCTDHQRKGIARIMVDLGLDYKKLKSEGVHGIVSEASSLANQTLLSNSGYKCIYEPKKYEWAEKMDDGTHGVKVFFLRL